VRATDELCAKPLQPCAYTSESVNGRRDEGTQTKQEIHVQMQRHQPRGNDMPAASLPNPETGVPGEAQTNAKAKVYRPARSMDRATLLLPSTRSSMNKLHRAFPSTPTPLSPRTAPPTTTPSPHRPRRHPYHRPGRKIPIQLNFPLHVPTYAPRGCKVNLPRLRGTV